VKKGAKLYLEGALQTRKWQDQQGQDRYSTEVVLQGFNSVLTMLDRAGGGGGGGDFGSDNGSDFGSSGTGGGGGGGRARQPAMAGGGGRRDDMDDEIPF
jgi:single-strand DNA-binding protein